MKPRVPTCTCGNAGLCGYCPRIAVQATRQGRLDRTSGDNGRAAQAAGNKVADRIERASTRRR